MGEEGFWDDYWETRMWHGKVILGLIAVLVGGGILLWLGALLLEFIKKWIGT